MTFEEIDKLIGDSLTKRYPNTERRDYYELERKWLEKDPNHRKGQREEKRWWKSYKDVIL